MKFVPLSACLLTLGCMAPTGSTLDANQSFDLNDLKNKCTELAQNQQLKPFSATVSCREVSYEWRKMQMQNPINITINNRREVGATVRLKSFQVPYSSESVMVAPTPADCTVLEEIKMVVPAVDIELSCADVQQVDSIANLCGPAITERLTDDPSIIRETRTGRMFNTCFGLLTPNKPDIDESRPCAVELTPESKMRL